MGSHIVTCYPTQVNTPRLNPSHTGRYSTYLPRMDGRLSWQRIGWESNQRPFDHESNAQPLHRCISQLVTLLWNLLNHIYLYVWTSERRKLFSGGPLPDYSADTTPIGLCKHWQHLQHYCYMYFNIYLLNGLSGYPVPLFQWSTSNNTYNLHEITNNFFDLSSHKHA